MRLALLTLLVAGCATRTIPAAASPSGLPAFAAARWVPDRPMYVVTSPSLGDAQRTARDAIDLGSVAAGFDLRDAMRASIQLFGIDVLHPDPVAAIGVDLAGSWALFGDESGPTAVLHLAAPAQMAAFLDHQRDRGLITRSVIVDQIEVVSAMLPVGLRVGWAIDRDWMWIHVAVPGAPDDAGRWFAASHARHGAGWTGAWAWAQRGAGAASALVGVLDLHGPLAGAIGRLPDALACAKLAEPIGRVALAVEGDGHHVSARVALDVGSTERLRTMLLPPPSGWPATVARAALALAWNLDLAAVRGPLAPCLAALGAPVALLDETSVRAARAVLLGFDPDAMSGAGAIALDVSSTAYLERQLDRIPLRRAIERPRTFGPYLGASIAIPFSVTVEYVLAGQLAIAALGDGVLAGLVTGTRGGGPPQPPPIFAIDVAPPALSAQAWETVVHGLASQKLDGTPGAIARRAAQQLLAWRDAHLAVTAEGSDLVVSVSGNRR